VWEFDPAADDPEEISAADAARREFTSRRHQIKNSSDLLMRMQVSMINPDPLNCFSFQCC
jgi:cycloartenol synthase